MVRIPEYRNITIKIKDSGTCYTIGRLFQNYVILRHKKSGVV